MIDATLPSNAGLVLNIRMPLPVSLFIGLRYSQSRKGNAFISFITLFSVAGIFLGVMALTIVSSVMNGFEGELKKRILGVIPHLVVSAPAEYVEQWQTPLLRQPQVQQVTPFLQAEALVQSPRQLTGVLLQGVKTDALPDFMRQALLLGDWQQFASQRYAVVLGRALAEQHFERGIQRLHRSPGQLCGAQCVRRLGLPGERHAARQRRQPDRRKVHQHAVPDRLLRRAAPLVAEPGIPLLMTSRPDHPW